MREVACEPGPRTQGGAGARRGGRKARRARRGRRRRDRPGARSRRRGHGRPCVAIRCRHRVAHDASGAGQGRGREGHDRHLGRDRRGDPAAGARARGGSRARRQPGLGCAGEKMGQQRGPRGRRKGRGQRGEIGRTVGERGLERPAGAAGADVRAHAPPAQDAAVTVRQRALHVSAQHRPALRALVQPRARLEDRLLDRACRAVEDDRDLLVREPAQLAQDERRALALRQVAQVRAQQRQALAVLHRLRQRIRPQRPDRIQVHRIPALAQPRDRLVVRDPEQPGPQLEVPLLVAQGRQGLGHGALQRIARVLVVVQDRPAVAIQRLVMALVHRRQCRVVATGRLRAQRKSAPPLQRRGQPGGRRLLHGHTPHIGNAPAWQESGAISRTVSPKRGLDSAA